MKTRVMCLLLAILMMFGCVAFAEEEPSRQYLIKLEDVWSTETDDQQRVDLAWEILYMLKNAGFPVGFISANDLVQALDGYYNIDPGQYLWTAALITVRPMMVAAGYGDYQVKEPIEHYDGLFENDWYGSTTDDERIAMAGDLLNHYRRMGYAVVGVADHEVAQEMNNYYDVDKSLSIFSVFEIVIQPTIEANSTLRFPSDFSLADTAELSQYYMGDWYSISDEERIEVAWSTLSILGQMDYDFAQFSAESFAQAINDLYDANGDMPFFTASILAVGGTPTTEVAGADNPLVGTWCPPMDPTYRYVFNDDGTVDSYMHDGYYESASYEWTGEEGILYADDESITLQYEGDVIYVKLYDGESLKMVRWLENNEDARIYYADLLHGSWGLDDGSEEETINIYYDATWDSIDDDGIVIETGAIEIYGDEHVAFIDENGATFGMAQIQGESLYIEVSDIYLSRID